MFLSLPPYRSYDVVHTLPVQLREQHDRVHRQVFMVCVRMATHKESKVSPGC